jgi:hypothetical protein
MKSGITDLSFSGYFNSWGDGNAIAGWIIAPPPLPVEDINIDVRYDGQSLDEVTYNFAPIMTWRVSKSNAQSDTSPSTSWREELQSTLPSLGNRSSNFLPIRI